MNRMQGIVERLSRVRTEGLSDVRTALCVIIAHVISSPAAQILNDQPLTKGRHHHTGWTSDYQPATYQTHGNLPNVRRGAFVISIAASRRR